MWHRARTSALPILRRAGDDSVDQGRLLGHRNPSEKKWSSAAPAHTYKSGSTAAQRASGWAREEAGAALKAVHEGSAGEAPCWRCRGRVSV